MIKYIILFLISLNVFAGGQYYESTTIENNYYETTNILKLAESKYVAPIDYQFDVNYNKLQFGFGIGLRNSNNSIGFAFGGLIDCACGKPFLFGSARTNGNSTEGHISSSWKTNLGL